MSRPGPALLVALVLAAGGARAQAPEEALRPAARAEPEAPGRPQAREAQVEAASGATPLVLAAEPSVPSGPPGGDLAPGGPGRDLGPSLPRRAPVLATGPEPEAPALEGPRQVVRAEALMADPPRLPIVVRSAWDGEGPLARPLAVPVLARPQARPALPQDPTPFLPPEPDAPPAYVPDGQGGLLLMVEDVSVLAVARAVVPAPRPSGLGERAIRVRALEVRGQVCGNALIQGEVVAPMRDGGGCGIAEPVRVRSLDGVRLSEGALMDCPTAYALLDWVRHGARAAIGSRGGGLAGIDVMGHYACRPRNNQAGARLSEHGRGHAIDVGGLILADGSTLSVLRDWPDPALREMHAAACGPFSTVLGPAANAQHRDHFHFDTARGRGPYCR